MTETFCDLAEAAAISRDKILEELKAQMEVNRLLARELMDIRLELEKLKAGL